MALLACKNNFGSVNVVTISPLSLHKMCSVFCGGFFGEEAGGRGHLVVCGRGALDVFGGSLEVLSIILELGCFMYVCFGVGFFVFLGGFGFLRGCFGFLFYNGEMMYIDSGLTKSL